MIRSWQMRVGITQLFALGRSQGHPNKCAVDKTGVRESRRATAALPCTRSCEMLPQEDICESCIPSLLYKHGHQQTEDKIQLLGGVFLQNRHWFHCWVFLPLHLLMSVVSMYLLSHRSPVSLPRFMELLLC